MTTTEIATITAQFPCHPERKVRLDVLSSRYDRTCPECGAVYTVDRSTVKVGAHGRIDTATWERTA